MICFVSLVYSEMDLFLQEIHQEGWIQRQDQVYKAAVQERPQPKVQQEKKGWKVRNLSPDPSYRKSHVSALDCNNVKPVDVMKFKHTVHNFQLGAVARCHNRWSKIPLISGN